MNARLFETPDGVWLGQFMQSLGALKSEPGVGKITKHKQVLTKLARSNLKWSIVSERFRHLSSLFNRWKFSPASFPCSLIPTYWVIIKRPFSPTEWNCGEKTVGGNSQWEHSKAFLKMRTDANVDNQKNFYVQHSWTFLLLRKYVLDVIYGKICHFEEKSKHDVAFSVSIANADNICSISGARADRAVSGATLHLRTPAGVRGEKLPRLQSSRTAFQLWIVEVS